MTSKIRNALITKDSKMTPQADKIYLDVQITNLNASTVEPSAIYYNQNRQNPYLQNPSEYYLSIVRFYLSTQTLPVFIPTIQPNQSNPNLTTYSVSLQIKMPGGAYSTNLYTARQYIIWSPQYSAEPVPIPPSQSSNGLQVDAKYYYAFNLEYFILLILEAYSKCYATLIGNTNVAGSIYAVNGVPSTGAMSAGDVAYFSSLNNSAVPPVPCTAPIFTFDTQNNIAVMYAQTVYYNNVVGNNPTLLNANAIQVYMNTSLFNLFSSFPAKSLGVSATFGCNYRLAIADYTGSNNIFIPTTLTPAQGAYLCTTVIQEYSTIQSWSPIDSIAFVSNTIPIVSNLLSAPLVLNNNKQVISDNGVNANFLQIITDLVSTDNNYQPYLLYEPSAQYRLIDMYGDRPLTNLDISVFWKNKLGNFIPITLPSGGSCDIKFLFTKKGSQEKF